MTQETWTPSKITHATCFLESFLIFFLQKRLVFMSCNFPKFHQPIPSRSNALNMSIIIAKSGTAKVPIQKSGFCITWNARPYLKSCQIKVVFFTKLNAKICQSGRKSTYTNRDEHHEHENRLKFTTGGILEIVLSPGKKSKWCCLKQPLSMFGTFTPTVPTFTLGDVRKEKGPFRRDKLHFWEKAG